MTSLEKQNQRFMTLLEKQNQNRLEKQDQNLRAALHLIKVHISEKNTQQNRDLHAAVQLIVDVARQHGLLLL